MSIDWTLVGEIIKEGLSAAAAIAKAVAAFGG